MTSPSVYILEVGSRVEVVKLRGLMQGLVEAQAKVAQAAADKKGALKAIEDAGLNKAVAKAVLARHNKKQLELDMFDHTVTAYEEALGWRDPNFDLGEESRSAQDVIARTEAKIQDPPPAAAKRAKSKTKAKRKPAKAKQKALPAPAKKPEDGDVDGEPGSAGETPKPNGGGDDPAPMTADEYNEQFMGGGA